MNSDSITRLQEQLRLIGHHSNNIPLVSVDGIYGEETANAVRAFQRAFGLNPTGELDFDTWEAINEVYFLVLENTSGGVSISPFRECDTLISEGDKSPTVLLVQVMLDTIAEEFANLSRVSPTGVYDTQTVKAVKEFQLLNALDSDGRVNKSTWNALARLFNNNLREC